MAAIVTNLYIIVVFFIVFIIPLWLLLHYTMRTKVAKLSNDDKARLEDLQQQAKQLAQRVAILETILDEKAPNWRQQDDD
jgi:phage shock protein B